MIREYNYQKNNESYRIAYTNFFINMYNFLSLCQFLCILCIFVYVSFGNLGVGTDKNWVAPPTNLGQIINSHNMV